jgi:hypothetical protein
MDRWNADFAETLPLLHPLRESAKRLAGDDWPALPLLQRLADEAALRTAGGRPLQLLPQDPGGRLPYEIRVFERGELECRERNWHDFFNLLMWLRYPKAKAALNARHHAAWSAAPAGGRGPVRDALTLFDESGVVVLSADGDLLRMIRGFHWKELFWTRREAVVAGLRFLPFGHALCEKALAPYRGMTGHALLFEVDAGFFTQPEAVQRAAVDGLLARRIADPQSMASARELSPLPLLGVPGWCAANAAAAYYDDRDHFRPGRRVRTGRAAAPVS